MIIKYISRRILVLFFSFQILCYAVLVERGKDQINVLNIKSILINNVKSDTTNNIKEEDKNYDIGFHGLTKKQEIRRKEILKERRVKVLKYLEKLRRRQKMIKNKLYK